MMTARIRRRGAATNAPHDGGAAKRRRTWWPWAALGLAVALVVVTYQFASRDGAGAASEVPTGAVVTAQVTTATIADTRTFSGTLGHGEPHTVMAPGTGVLTRIAAHGTAIEAGTELFRIDERPVIALHADIPMYRDLAPGDIGVDVEQLVANLTALGYADCGTVDELTACVADAVRAWQDDVGVEPSGVVAAADIAFVPHGTRVDTIHRRVGDAVNRGATVLDLTGTDQVVLLEAEVRHRYLLPVGAVVSTVLPGGVEVTGSVTSANVVAMPGAGGSTNTVTLVEVTLHDRVDDAFLAGPAEVVVEIDRRVDVLTVPVNALLALAGGGHGVEVVAQDGTVTLIPVSTGLFAGGRVEVTGAGIEEGTTVVVAGR